MPIGWQLTPQPHNYILRTALRTGLRGHGRVASGGRAAAFGAIVSHLKTILIIFFPSDFTNPFYAKAYSKMCVCLWVVNNMPHNNNIHLLEDPSTHSHTHAHTFSDEMFAVNDLKKPKAEKQTKLPAHSIKKEKDEKIRGCCQLLLLLKQIANNKQKFTGSSKKCA